MFPTLSALIAVLIVAFPVITWVETAVCRQPVRGMSWPAGAAPRFWVTWLLITVLEFTVPSFPLFLFFAGIVVLARAHAEPVPVALCLALVAAVPQVGADLPTFGLVEHILPMTFISLISILLLVPQLFNGSGAKLKETAKAVARPWVLAYFLWGIVLAVLSSSTFTGVLRLVVGNFLAIYLPFSAAAKALRSFDALQRLMALYVTMMAGLAAMAVLEYGKSWLLFGELPHVWGIDAGGLNYLMRGTALRAQTSTGQPIILGFLLAIALVMAISPALYRAQPKRRPFTVAILTAGLFATISRGPWLGAAGGVLFYLALDRGGVGRALKFVAVMFLLLLVAAMLPGGEKIIDLLPWIGKADPGSTEYRANLFNAVAPLLLDHPLRGLPDYDSLPELQFLRQGQGLIDFVNFYLAVGVSSGLVGLVAFVGSHARVVFALWKLLPRLEGEPRELARAFFAAYVTLLLVLMATSASQMMVFVIWFVVGTGSAILTMQVGASAPKAQAAARGRRGNPPPRALPIVQ